SRAGDGLTRRRPFCVLKPPGRPEAAVLRVSSASPVGAGGKRGTLRHGEREAQNGRGGSPVGPLRPSIPPQPVESGRREAFAARAPRAVALLLAIVLTAVLAPGGAGAARRFTLETEHFLVHFDGGYEALAHEVARIAEEVHRELAPRVGHVPSEKTHLVLADTTDLANGRSEERRVGKECRD